MDAINTKRSRNPTNKKEMNYKISMIRNLRKGGR